MLRFTFLMAIFTSCKLIGEGLAYDCGVMNCNWDNQFCNHEQERCENCDGHRHSCFTHMMQENCTAFCRGHELQKQKEKGCKEPPSVMFGHVEVTGRFHKYGSQVKVTCSPNYRLLGNPYLTCGEYGQWTHLPICEDSWPDIRMYILIVVLAPGWVLFFILCNVYICIPKLRSKKKDSAKYNDYNTDTKNATEEMQELLIDKDMFSVAIDMDVKENALHSNGLSHESGKSTAEPVSPSKTGQTEEEETTVLDSHNPICFPRQLSGADNDDSRVKQTGSTSIPEPSSCENNPNCETANDRVQNRETNSASTIGPTICQKCQRSEVSLKSKDSGFESRASLGTCNDGNKGVAFTGSNNGNILVVHFNVNDGNNDPKDDNETIACDTCADPVQETGMTKELEESNQVGMMETAMGKADFVIG